MYYYTLFESLFSVERLMIFKRHPIYLVTHIILGFVGYYYPLVLYSTLGYQAFQYFMNFRFFLFQLEIKSGNSFGHTALKIAEIIAGYFIAVLYDHILT
jgi:hypothetical protein